MVTQTVFGALSLSLLTIALAAPDLASLNAPRIVRRVPVPSTDVAAPLVATPHYSELVRVKGTNSTKHRSAGHLKGYGSAKLRDLYLEEEWSIKIKIAGKESLVIFDTGSSDTWVVQEGFQCVSQTKKPVKESKCAFGPVYNGTFENGMIKNRNFNITYGDGEFLTGPLGYSDVELAGLTVKNQEVSLVDYAYWEGDSFSSGLIGVAYKSLGSAFIGDDPTLDNFNLTGKAPGDQSLYSPIMQTMISQGLNPPLFSLALQRSKSKKNLDTLGGYVAFGGLPPVAVDPSAFISTPIEVYEFYEYPSLEGTVRSFYTMTPDGYLTGDKTVTSGLAVHQAIVDSGTTLIYAPPNVLTSYVSLLPPTVQHREGYYYLPCKTNESDLPPFGVSIGGTVFNVSAADIILPGADYTDKKTGLDYCVMGIQNAGPGVYDFPILGDVFLKNVVAVFDVGQSMLRFAQHVY